MIRFYRLLAGLLLLAPAGFAQQFYTPGYAITTSGDTLRGDIRVKTNALIEFRHAATSLEKEFGPDELRTYTVEGVYYTAAAWQDDEGNPRRAFLRQRLRGYVSLYSFPKEEGDFRYVMQLPDGSFVPLRGKLAWGKLNLALNECNDPAFARRIQSNLFRYDLSYFEGVIKSYNACVRPDLTPRRVKKPFSFEIGLVAGGGYNSWNYFFGLRNSIPTLPVSRRASATLRPVVGAYVTILPHKRLSMTLEANYTSYKGSVQVEYALSPVLSNTSNYFFEEANLSIPLSGKYVWYDGAVRGYLRGGFAITLPLHLRVQRDVVGKIDAYDLLQLRAGKGFGPLVGVGADWKLAGKRTLFVEARAQRHSVTEGVNRIAHSYSFQALLGVSLFRR